MNKIVIALGGNALQEAGKPATAQAQLEVVERTSVYIADILEKDIKLFWRTAMARRWAAWSFRTNMRSRLRLRCRSMFAVQ